MRCRTLCLTGGLVLYASVLTSFVLYILLRPREQLLTRLHERVSKTILVESMAQRTWIALRSEEGCGSGTTGKAGSAKDAVHISTIILGHPVHMEKFEILLSSVLRSRDPKTCHYYHFHIFTNEALLQKLCKFLNTSTLAFQETFTSELFGFKITPYDGHKRADETLYSKAVESNAHYSGSPGLLKLSLERILPGVDRLISLDCDVLVMSDLANLWAESLRAPQFIGIVGEQSEWYRDDDDDDNDNDGGGEFRWPHIRSGFNSGVMLLDLAQMRANGGLWETLWRKAFDDVYLERPGQELHLGDQDVFNAAIKYNPEIMHELECGWNLQDAGLKSRALFCPAEDWRIFHANFHAKKRNFWSGLMESFRLKNIGDNGFWRKKASFVCSALPPSPHTAMQGCLRKDLRIFL